MTYTAELKRIKKVLFAAAGQSTSVDSGDRGQDNRRAGGPDSNNNNNNNNNNNLNADDNSSDDQKVNKVGAAASGHKSADSAAGSNTNDKSQSMDAIIKRLVKYKDDNKKLKSILK